MSSNLNKNFRNFVSIIIVTLMFSACAEYMMLDQELNETFTPEGFLEDYKNMPDTTAVLGPKVNLNKSVENQIQRRVYIDENEVSDYTKIISSNFSDVFPISVNFENIEFREVMNAFSAITGKNILVGDEVDGQVSIKVKNENWDDVLEAILEIKNVALTISPNTNIVRIHEKDVLTAQETYNRKRKAEIRQAMELAKAIAPIRSEIFRLFYTTPSVVKGQIEDVLKNIDATSSAGEDSEDSEGGTGQSERVKITVDARLNALVVLGSKDDLDFVEKLVNEIDVPTKQILIEAFVVEVGSAFQKAFGARVGQRGENISGDVNKEVSTGTITYDEENERWVNTIGLGNLANNAISAVNGQIGMMFRANNFDLFVELQAMESKGLSRIVSNPKIFTLDNNTAEISQGQEIPFTTTEGGETTTEFKDADLKLSVTPSVVGDGNIILDIDISKDNADTSVENPPISSTKVTTKLLVEDNTIVMIGGIYEQTTSRSKSETPILRDIPVLGNLFKNASKSDNLDQLLIFIAPKIL